MSCNTRYWHNMAAAQKDRICNPAAAARQDKALKDLIAAREKQDAAWSFKAAEQSEACTTQTALHPPTVLSVLQQSRQNSSRQAELR